MIEPVDPPILSLSMWSGGAHVQACVQRLSSVKAKQHLLRQWRKWKGLEK